MFSNKIKQFGGGFKELSESQDLFRFLSFNVLGRTGLYIAYLAGSSKQNLLTIAKGWIGGMYLLYSAENSWNPAVPDSDKFTI